MTSVLSACLAIVSCTVQGASSTPIGKALGLRVTDTPHAVKTDAGLQVFEEVHLANEGTAPLRLRELEVVDAREGQALATFEGKALAGRFATLGSSAPQDGTVVPPGREGVVYVEWVPHGRLPTSVEHVARYTALPGTEIGIVRGARAAVSYAIGTPLGPPLRGGPWVAIHAASWPRGPRRVFDTVDGKARIPGRFAVDWVRVDAAGRITRGDPDIPRNALGYGVDVLAVANATMVALRRDMTEASSVAGNPRHALDEEAGNNVAIRLDAGRYAFYEHLEPGSIGVEVGQRVRRGEVLGKLGFTGSPSGPHLHFHVADGPSTIAAEGRPFVIDAFELLGRYDDPAMLGKVGWTPRRQGEAAQRHDEWPAENAVVRFAQ